MPTAVRSSSPQVATILGRRTRNARVWQTATPQPGLDVHVLDARTSARVAEPAQFIDYSGDAGVPLHFSR
jgi:hypothetical protein